MSGETFRINTLELTPPEALGVDSVYARSLGTSFLSG